MKKSKIILALSCLIIVAFCAINVQNSLITSKKAGYFSLNDILNSAKAGEEGSSGDDCNGPTCEDANGNKYNTGGIGDNVKCCGVAHSTRGKQKT